MRACRTDSSVTRRLPPRSLPAQRTPGSSAVVSAARQNKLSAGLIALESWSCWWQRQLMGSIAVSRAVPAPVPGHFCHQGYRHWRRGTRRHFAGRQLHSERDETTTGWRASG